MANCNSSCSGYSECDDSHDGQVYTLTTRQSRFWYSDECGNEAESNYEQAINLLPDKIAGEDYDEVPAGAHKNFYLDGWMEQPPGHALDTDCNHHCTGSGTLDSSVDCQCTDWACEYEDYYRVIPERCDFAIQHPHDHRSDDTDYQLQFLVPHPDYPDERDGTSVEDLLIPAATAGASFTHPIVAAGAAMTAEWVDNVDFDVNTELYREDIDSSNHRLVWEIPLSASHQNDMPNGPCNTSSVKFRLDGGSDQLVGKEQLLYTYYRNSYTYRKYTEETPYCTSNSFNCDSVFEYQRDSNPVRHDYYFELY
jgi:hypothetical protein